MPLLERCSPAKSIDFAARDDIPVDEGGGNNQNTQTSTKTDANRKAAVDSDPKPRRSDKRKPADGDSQDGSSKRSKSTPCTAKCDCRICVPRRSSSSSGSRSRSSHSSSVPDPVVKAIQDQLKQMQDQMNTLTVGMLNMSKVPPPAAPIPKKQKQKQSASATAVRPRPVHSMSPDPDEDLEEDEDEDGDVLDDDDEEDDNDQGDDYGDPAGNDTLPHGSLSGSAARRDAFTVDDEPPRQTPSASDYDIVANLRAIYKLESSKGEDIDEELATTLKEIFAHPLDEGEIDETLRRHKAPGNLGKLLDSDRTNKEVWLLVPQGMRKCDTELQKVQLYNLRSLVPLLRMHQLAKQFGGEVAKKMMPQIRDAIILSVASNDKLVSERKYLLKPYIDKLFQSLCRRPDDMENVDFSEQTQLFGDKIGDKVTELKTAAAISRTIAKKKQTTTTTTPEKKQPFLGKKTGGNAPWYKQKAGRGGRKGNRGGRTKRQQQRAQQYQAWQQYGQQLPQFPFPPPPGPQGNAQQN